MADRNWGLRFAMARTDISVAYQRSQILRPQEMGSEPEIGLSDVPGTAASALSYRLRAVFIAASAAGLWLALYEGIRLTLGA